MDDVDLSAADEAVRECALLGRDVVTPIAAPMDREHDDVAQAPVARNPLNQAVGGIVRELADTMHPGTLRPGRPSRGYAARRTCGGMDEDAPPVRELENRRRMRLRGVPPGTGRRDAEGAERRKRFLQPLAAPVED